MNDFAISNGITPTIALLTSDGVEEVSRRNQLSFGDLLIPFSTVQTSISDPSGQQSPVKLSVNLRDIRRNGHLLSLTVMPSVLQETIRLRSSKFGEDDAWSSGFKEFFHYWLEPCSHDFLKSYISCVFAVSVSDPDPLTTLSNLIQQQNYQQHGSGESASSLSAAHCANPKWFLPQILKYYVLVQDLTKDTDEKAQSIFTSMTSTYGQQFCYHLKINSTENSNMPDPWSNLLIDRYCGLENGLDVARRKLLNNKEHNPSANIHDLSTLDVSSISTVSSDLNALHLNIDNNEQKRPTPKNSPNPTAGVRRGDCLSSEDRERIRNFIEHFVKNVLVTFVEKQLVTQNEALMNRRGIGKSFTTMKKWLNVASVTPQLSSTPIAINYANESPEMQTRRLADLSFLFGLYNYSNQLYQTLKKDFLNDQAWLHHAGALEMAALSSFLGATPAQLKNYPGRYMENAIEFYAKTCGQPLLAVRCVLYSAEILVYLEKYADAANQIIRIASGLPDIYGGVFLERAATLFEKSKMFRRQAFHSVLAGHRYEQSDLMQLAFRCYRKSLPEYMDKAWTNAEDNVLCVVSRDPSLRQEDRIECSQRLVRPYCLNQSDEQQEIFLKAYLRQTTDENRVLAVPIILDVQTFFGETPTALSEDDMTKEDFPTAFTPDGIELVFRPAWADIEKAAFLAIFGLSLTFRPLNSFATKYTNNTEVNITPANEKFTVRLKMVNPMKIPLRLTKVCLRLKEINSAEKPFSQISQIDKLELPGISLVENTNLSSDILYLTETHDIQAELYCIPTEMCRSFTVDALEFNVAVGESEEVFQAKIPINVRGRRLFGKKAENAVDNRLKAQVSSKPHPLLDFQVASHLPAEQSLEIQTTCLNLFCSQIYHINLQISNTGNCGVNQLCAALDRPELITFYDPEANTQFKFSANNYCTGVYTSLLLTDGQTIGPGEVINFQLIVHAPSLPINSEVLRLLFMYSSADKVNRQWRHKIELTATPLVRSEICMLDLEDKLCALKIKNEINSRDSILVQIECLRLEAKLRTSGGLHVDLHPLSNRKIILDTDQSDLYCFYIRFTQDVSRPIIMNEDRNKLHWPYLSETQSDHLQFALTWRAKITRDTTSSIHGQSIISNPFIQFDSEELNLLTETANSSVLIQARLLRQLVPVEIGRGEKLNFALSVEECRRQANAKSVGTTLPDVIKIPWSLDV